MELHFRDISNYEDLQAFIKRAETEQKKLYLEVGFGSGIVFRQRVIKEKDVLHLGFELKRDFVNRIEKFAQKNNFDNIMVKRVDAKYILPRFIKPESFDKIFIYYPDPWWKKKHKKYILFDYYFIADLYRTLKKGGKLNIKTDVVDYFELIKEKFSKFGYFQECDFNDFAAENFKSTFEIKALKAGRSLHKTAYCKNS